MREVIPLRTTLFSLNNVDMCIICVENVDNKGLYYEK